MSDSVTLWTVGRQAPLSMGFPRQEYWSGLPCSPPGDLSNPGVEPASPEAPALAGGFCTTESLGKQKENEGHRKANEFRDIPGGPVVNNQPYNVRDMGLVLGELRSHMPQDN